MLIAGTSMHQGCVGLSTGKMFVEIDQKFCNVIPQLWCYFLGGKMIGLGSHLGFGLISE